MVFLIVNKQSIESPAAIIRVVSDSVMQVKL